MKWIKVKEKRPPTDVPILIFAERVIFGEYVYYGGRNGDDYRWYEAHTGYISDEDVTHWMALPKPPEEK
jgi:hypothetical protein